MNIQQKPPPRFACVPIDQIMVNTARNYLVKGIIPRRGLVVVYGPPKCGKSFWIFDLTMHVALGWPYRGRRVQRGPVVYLVMEGADGFRNRVEAFRARIGDGHDEPIDMFLVFASVDLIKNHVELIADIRAQSLAPVAVVIDTLNRTLVGSESKDEDMAAYLRAAGAIEAAFGCATIIVHHSGLEAGRPRGHTSLTGAADAQLAVTRDTANNIVVTVERCKDGPEGDVITSRLLPVEVGIDVDGDPISSCIIEAVDGPAAAKKGSAGPKLNKGARTALDALTEAVSELGKVPPASNHIPAGVLCVSITQWREYAYRRGISTSEEPRARQQAFSRASDTLNGARRIGIWDDLVWPV